MLVDKAVRPQICAGCRYQQAVGLWWEHQCNDFDIQNSDWAWPLTVKVGPVSSLSLPPWVQVPDQGCVLWLSPTHVTVTHSLWEHNTGNPEVKWSGHVVALNSGFKQSTLHWNSVQTSTLSRYISWTGVTTSWYLLKDWCENRILCYLFSLQHLAIHFTTLFLQTSGVLNFYFVDLVSLFCKTRTRSQGENAHCHVPFPHYVLPLQFLCAF